MNSIKRAGKKQHSLMTGGVDRGGIFCRVWALRTEENDNNDNNNILRFHNCKLYVFFHFTFVLCT